MEQNEVDHISSDEQVKDVRALRESLQESAYSRKYTGEEVSSIVRKRIGNLNEYIEALEMENTALTTEIKEMKKNERR